MTTALLGYSPVFGVFTAWQVERLADGGAPTLVEGEDAARAVAEAARRNHPLVSAALAAFPQAEILAADGPDHGQRNWSQSA